MEVKKKSELPSAYIVLTLGLSYPLDSDRVAVKTEPYPGRWTTHFVIGSEEEVDSELLSWVQEAHSAVSGVFAFYGLSFDIWGS